jgi:rhomboid protease GluP
LQFDLHKYFISNKIINLSSINDLKDHKYDTYFSISNCSFQNISYIYPVNQTSGRYGQDIDLRLYISVPFENSKEIYLGVKYKRSINNIKSYSSAELKDEIKSFFNDSYHDFKNKNLKNVSSLKQLRMSDDKINYIKALKSGNVNINNPIILEEMNFKDIAITDGISTTTYLLGIWLLLYIIIWTIIVYSVGINKIKNIAEMKGSFSLSKLFSEYLIHIVPNKKFFMMPLIIDINVIVFLLMIFNGVNILYPNILDLNHWGGISKVNILKGEYWRLITYMFVHSGITHLAGNMFTLFLISIFIETYLGKVKYLLLYIITGVISVIISINANPNTIVVGASAGIMGLVGFYLSFFLFKKTRDKFNLSFGPLFIIMILSTIAIGFLGNSDTVAHVTGLASGFIAGLVYDGFFVKKEADPNPQKFD